VLLGGLVLAPDVAQWVPALAAYWPAQYSPWGPLAAGSGVIVLHALVAAYFRDNDESDESIDASYFLGFVFTLLYLLFGLWSVKQTGISDAWVTTFLGDLGVGLSFTVVGLVTRQVNMLRRARNRVVQEATEVKSTTQELTDVAKHLLGAVQSMQATVGHLASPEQDRAAVRINEVVGNFERVVGDSTNRLAQALDELTTKSVTTTADLSGAWSRSRSSLQAHAEALEQQTRIVVERMTMARTELQHLLLETTKDATSTQKMVAVTARSQIIEWESQLKSMNENLVSVRALAERECKAAYEALSQSAVAFNALAIEVAERTKAMPDPTEHLQLVWSNVAGQEAQMVEAMSRVSTVLESLGSTTAKVTEQFGALEADARNSGVALVKGVAEVREGLQEQNRMLGDLVGEVVDVIEGRVNALAR
jgi:hypothetical protein